MIVRLAAVAAFLLCVAGCPENGPSVDAGSAADMAGGADAGPLADGATTGQGSDAVAVSDCMPKVHPGTVTYVNGDTGEVRVQPVDPSNESRFWVTTAEGRIPIVKVVFRRLDARTAEIKSFGPCDQLLEVTIGTT